MTWPSRQARPAPRVIRRPLVECVRGSVAGSTVVKAFVAKHAPSIQGVLACFDRLIIRGHLPMASVGYFATWLRSKNVTLRTKDIPQGWTQYKQFVPQLAEQLKEHAKALAARAGRPFQHLSTHQRMELTARELAQKDNVTDGLVCVYSTMETCRTFRVRFNAKGPDLGPDLRVCLVLYYYYMDREFGLIHIKIQTWAPFTVQVYLNGHEWLAKKLDAAQIGYEKVDNAFVRLDDLAATQKLAGKFATRDWPALLNCFARRVNPLLSGLLSGQSYYWVIDQAEFSTDVLFTDRNALERLRPHLYEHAALCFGAPEVMTFLGRKYRPTFQGEVRTRWHRREPGAAVKHWMKRNALKMYDKDGRVLRIETVINDPREFKVHRTRQKQHGGTEVGWFAMSKGIANLYRYAQVGRAANTRYLEALAVVDDLGVGQKQLDQLCGSVAYQGRKRRAVQPLSRDDQALFGAVLRGEYAVRGFKNGELARVLYGEPPKSALERRRRCARVGRQISLLRAHALVAKIPRSRRYRVTELGQRFMSTAIALRQKLFPQQLSRTA